MRDIYTLNLNNVLLIMYKNTPFGSINVNFP